MHSVAAFGFLCLLFYIVSAAPPPYVEKYYEQTLDHFNFHWQTYGKATFQQRYFVQDKWWDKDGGGPIFFYTGNEDSLEVFWNMSGFLFDIAPRFNAIIVFAEHRFYGKSLPFGEEQSFEDPYVSLLTVEQALADFATLLSHLKQEWNVSSVPTITFGGSYGGMLSTWFRFKYPNIVDGALAASAPILMPGRQVDRNFFFPQVTKDFHDASPGCDTAVRNSFTRIQQLADQGPTGLASLSKTFGLCSAMESSHDYRHFLFWLRNNFVTLSMFDYPYPTRAITRLPGYPVQSACKIVKSAADPVQGMFSITEMVYGKKKCHDIYAEYVECADPTSCGLGPTAKAWDYQSCTEICGPAGSNNVTDMFPPLSFTLDEREAYCNATWGIGKQRLDWMNVNYWGKKIQTATNIILSNGDLDPWRGGGVLEDISETLVAINIPGGAHHLDLRAANPVDPPEVTAAREQEVKIIAKWINQKQEQNRKLNRSR